MMGNRRGCGGVLNLKAEDAAQKSACQYHKKGGKEPGCYLLIDARLSHLPIMIDTQGTYDAQDGRQYQCTIHCRKES